MPVRLSHELFVEKLKNINPDVEVLSEYNGNKNYIRVRCLVDGNIWNTKPNWLVKGSKCQKCYDRERGDKVRKNLLTFIKECKEIHGDKYDYSKVNYVNNKTKVCIICPEHGEFHQTPNKHISMRQGCPKCANKDITTEEWVNKVETIHGNKYNYSKVDYINNKSKVCIICPEHGEFYQTPDKHLLGQGCPICSESKLEKRISNVLNVSNIIYERQKHFKWLGKQSLDFYLPDLKIGIECQGRQHFDIIKHFGGVEGFEKILRLDLRKNKLCKENNVKILYVLNKEDMVKYTNPSFADLYNISNVFLIEDIEKIDKIESLLL